MYIYDGASSAPDTVVMELVRGGYRTITSSIGGSSADTYQVEMATATVKVRGTTYECLSEQVIAYCGVYDGGITLTNASSSLDPGLGATHDYTAITLGDSPQPLLQAPGGGTISSHNLL